MTRPCPTCGTSGKDKDGHRCLECGGAGKALPDVANRFSVKHDLHRVEGILRSNLEHHLPGPDELDEDDAQSLSDLLSTIHGLAVRIHDELIPPKGAPAVAASSRLKVGAPITDDDEINCTFNASPRKPVNVMPCPHCKGESARTNTACPDCRGHGFIEILP